MSDQFDASASAAGYFYQARVALNLLLENGPGSLISVETLDDIVIDTSVVKELIQLKHIKTKANKFGDSSPNLWKTIRIWGLRLKSNSIDSNSTRLTLFTNTTIEEGSAVSYLVKGISRNERKALAILNKISETSENKDLKDSFDVFRSLTASQKNELVSLIDVFTEQPNVVEIRKNIERLLAISTRPTFLAKVADRVEGWWFDQITKCLMDLQDRELPYSLVQSYINDVQEEYHLDNLPIHFEDLKPPANSEIKPAERIFIEQLKLISISNPRIDKAISDYFRAFNQRTRWIEDGNLDLRHLEKYESTLKDEWERLFLETTEDLGDAPEAEDLVKGGKKIFNELQKRTDLNIRAKCTEAYVMRGTFHILANKLDIGWHPDFREQLMKLLFKAKEESSETMDGTPN